MPRYELNLWDYWRIIRKRKWIISLLFLAIFIATFSFGYSQEKIYQAAATVRYTSQMAVYLDQLIFQTSRLGDPMEAQARIACSYNALKKAAEFESLGLIKAGKTSAEETERIISYLQGIVSASPIEKTDLIKIIAFHPDPKMATLIANAMAQGYKDENLEEKSQAAVKTRAFLEERLNEIDNKLKETEKNISGFKESFFKNYIDEQKRVITESVRDLTSRRNEIKEKLTKTKAELWDEENLKTTQNEKYYDSKGRYNRMLDQLQDLELERMHCFGRNTERHPEVIRLTGVINKVKAEMTSYEANVQRPSHEQELARLRTEDRINEMLFSEYSQRLDEFNSRNNKIISMGDIALKDELILTEVLKKYPEKEQEFNDYNRDLLINEQIYQDLKRRHTAASVEAVQVSDVVLVDQATEPTSPIKPDTRRTIIIGILLGLIVGLAGGLLLEHLDTSVQTLEEVEEFIKLPILAMIPDTSIDKNHKIPSNVYTFLVSQIAPHSASAEAYRILRTALQIVCGQTYRVLAFTSATEKEGKSVTAINYALTLSQGGQKTLLIDADLRKSVIHKVFGINREPGLTDILEGKINYAKCVQKMSDFLIGLPNDIGTEILKTPGLENLSVLPAGHKVSQPSELLNSTFLTNFINTVRQEYRFIIFDTTPILPVTDAMILASKVDAVVLSHHMGSVARGVLYRAKSQLETAKTKILGIVLTRIKPAEMETGLPYHYYGHKRYQYGKPA
jgi:tyrosine-protein kinase Etk/Wzc